MTTRYAIAIFALLAGQSYGKTPLIRSIVVEGQHADLQNFIGQRPSNSALRAIGDAVAERYSAMDQPVVVANATVTKAGQVRVTVSQGRVGKLTVSGRKELPLRAIGKSLVIPGVLTGRAIQERLDWLRRNPFFEPAIAASPGDGPGVADLAFQLDGERARYPFRAFTGYANDGVAPLGQNRWSAGFQWGNAFTLGQTLSASASMADDPGEFTSAALDWRIPLPWRHDLVFSAARAWTSIEKDGVQSDGTVSFANMRYRIPHRISSHWAIEPFAGVDAKRFDTDATFGGGGALASTLDVATATLGIEVRRDGDGLQIESNFEVIRSLPGTMPNHNSDAYGSAKPKVQTTKPQTFCLCGDTNPDEAFALQEAQLHPAPKPKATPRLNDDFWLARFDIRATHSLPHGWSASLRASGQWADGPLVVSEELSLAGRQSVRGYDDRSIRADRGAFASLELRTPELTRLKTQWQGVAFGDIGRVDSAHETTQTRNPASLGIGLRARRTERFTVECDVAFPLSGETGPRLHASAVIYF